MNLTCQLGCHPGPDRGNLRGIRGIGDGSCGNGQLSLVNNILYDSFEDRKENNKEQRDPEKPANDGRDPEPFSFIKWRFWGVSSSSITTGDWIIICRVLLVFCELIFAWNNRRVAYGNAYRCNEGIYQESFCLRDSWGSSMI